MLRWYDRHQRDLPWRRRQRDPYAQWVAEIMLQQTRVDTVIDYYNRFLRRFPTVRALAEADHHDVLKHWEGLGYYRRALHLHRAAKVVRDGGAGMPRTAAELQQLSGVGDYTAAAIASIAYGESRAAVDGNVARVIARLFGIDEDLRASSTRKAISAVAQALLSPTRPGDFNQAWMDLGSAVCTPKSPNCPVCPLLSNCRAAATNRADSLPVMGAKNKPVVLSLIVGVFVRDRRILIRRRPEGGLWSGLWEFPTIECSARDGHEIRLHDLAAAEGIAPHDRPRKIGLVRHLLSHRALRFHIYTVGAAAGLRWKPSGDRRWVTPRMFERLAVSTAHRRIHAVFSRCEAGTISI